ncbi:MAG TPA: flagellin, partial [Clostridia bacterium]|nr:flagellin [Clostridia bacterium]
MRINNNLMALNTFRQYTVNNGNAAAATEKLSSGVRINRAGDDAAGLAISEKMRAQIRGLNMASKNSQDAISLVQTAEGALTETHSILQRMRELAVQSASDTNEETVDRVALNAEFAQLKDEINDIADKTKFNNKELLKGTFGVTTEVSGTSTMRVGQLGISSISFEGFAANASAYTISFTQTGATGTAYTAEFDGDTVQVDYPTGTTTKIELDFGAGRKVSIGINGHGTDAFKGQSIVFNVTGDSAIIQTGANEHDNLKIEIGNMKADALGVTDSIEIDTQAKASSAITTVDNAINTVSTQRAKLGALQNRL